MFELALGRYFVARNRLWVNAAIKSLYRPECRCPLLTVAVSYAHTTCSHICWSHRPILEARNSVCVVFAGLHGCMDVGSTIANKRTR